jgi:hypothetical protein
MSKEVDIISKVVRYCKNRLFENNIKAIKLYNQRYIIKGYELGVLNSKFYT